MKNKTLRLILLIAGFALAIELVVTAVLCLLQPAEPAEAAPEAHLSTAETLPEPEPEALPEPEPQPEPEPEPAVQVSGQLVLRERTEEKHLLTFAGDCTLASDAMSYGAPGTFVGIVGDNYAYPLASVQEYFGNDDCTFINLECSFTEMTNTIGTLFAFRGPPEYTNILTQGSVEFASFSNNHIYDYGEYGYNDTKEVLDAAGIPYVETNSSKVFTTESGLTVGVYATYFARIDELDMVAEIQALRDSGVDLVIASMHWGVEGTYRPTYDQEYYGHLAIDSGADIVYGHHPHVLQRIEEYGDGIIYYSLGNFSFGGNTNPRDMDTAIIQQEIIRGIDGEIRLGEMTLIPCSVSSVITHNDYQPTPLTEDNDAYARALSKLDGTFEGADLVVDYSAFYS
ncbi:MAG: CapA family protein [Oscillospiraceae bacterium]|nr:CapA family protein [Oscillospiraceae bacterium]